MTTSADQSAVDLDQVRSAVDRAIKTAVPPDQIVQRKSRPESNYSWPEPRPLAGLQAALTVARMARAQAHKFATALRGEGSSWRQIADLLEIPWSDHYSRTEQAYELVVGATPGTFSDTRVYWTCGGPGGCGGRVTDHGPYNGYPSDNETGHTDGCHRLAAEVTAYEREQAELAERDRVMDEAMGKVTDPFGKETVQRARYVQSHGGRYLGWSTSETLAVALVLRDGEQIKASGYPTQKAALERVMSSLSQRPADAGAWLRLLRAAATGTR